MKKDLFSYIDRVIEDAHIAEGRPNRTLKGYAKLAIHTGKNFKGGDVVYPNKVGKKYLFVDGSEFGRVRRRVEYRLNRNLAKHFPALAGVEVVGSRGSCMQAEWYSLNPDGTIGERIK